VKSIETVAHMDAATAQLRWGDTVTELLQNPSAAWLYPLTRRKARTVMGRVLVDVKIQNREQIHHHRGPSAVQVLYMLPDLIRWFRATTGASSSASRCALTVYGANAFVDGEFPDERHCNPKTLARFTAAGGLDLGEEDEARVVSLLGDTSILRPARIGQPASMLPDTAFIIITIQWESPRDISLVEWWGLGGPERWFAPGRTF
jgi:hypothetical protein